MIALASRNAIDETIDRALARLVNRSAALGPAFGALVDAAGRAASGGKRLRPALVAASFDAFGGRLGDAPGLYSVAAAFELLHTAFVVHDDVIDHDVERRGVPNVSGEFRARGIDKGADATGAALLGDAAAILAGDLLLHEASRLIALAEVKPATRAHLLDLYDDAVHISAAGELADVEHSIAPGSTDTAAILDAAFNKTAVYTFRAPLVAGAVLADADAASLDALTDAADRLGLAFQLVDDLIGAFGSPDQAGRAAGSDLREAKQTPLVAIARKSADWDDVNGAISIAHTGPIAVRDAQLALERSGARQELRSVIEGTLTDVRLATDDPALPSAAGALLRDLADLVEARIP